MKKFLSAILFSVLLIPQTFAASNYESGYYTAKVTVNIRAQAGMQGKAIGNLQANEEIYVRDQKGQWCDVEYRAYEHAYILCSLLEEQEYTDDYYDDNYYDSYDYEDDYGYDSLPKPVLMEPKPCDSAVSICSGDFKVGITADLQNSDPYEDFHTMKINLHGQGRVNIKTMETPELSLSINGSVHTEVGSVQGSGEIVLKDKGYVRISNLQAMNFAGFSASMNEDIQKNITGRWFALPIGDTRMLASADMLMAGPDSETIDQLVAISTFVGTDINGSDTRYHYKVTLDDQKVNQLMGIQDGSKNTGAQATVNFWLDSSHRLVKGDVTAKIPTSSVEPISGTMTITFDSSSLNQDIHVTVPEKVETMPYSFLGGNTLLPL